MAALMHKQFMLSSKEELVDRVLELNRPAKDLHKSSPTVPAMPSIKLTFYEET